MSSAADPTAAFFANIRGSGLLDPVRLQELWAWIATERPDVQGVAKELSRRGWLSAFQIKEIFKGRGRELTIDRYVLKDLLGEGGMGRVFRAHDTRMGRDVAVKVIRKDKLQHPAAAGRFRHEIEALGKMRHPNVVEVYDADLAGGTQYYVMELIDGTDLTKVVRDRGPLPVAEACEYIRRAALGLQHAFEAGLVHRDIKPSNIIVGGGGRVVKLVDLGLARLMENEGAAGGAGAGRITQEGYVIGTPDFLAPEQARDPAGVDIRADVYSLGGTLYYILTGKVPFDGATPTEKLVKHCTDPPPGLLVRRPDAPPGLEQVIHWCMAKPPEARPQTPLQLALALQPFCPAPPVGSGRVPVPPPGGPVLGSGRVPAPAPHPAAAPAPGYPFPAAPAAPSTHPFPAPVVIPPPAERSSQIFRLPPRTTTADPIRRRYGPRFPWGGVFVGLGAVLVAGILGYAVYVQFLRTDGVRPPPESFTNSQGMRMLKLDGGTFRMGSPAAEAGRDANEGPAHSVTVTGPLFVSATEVTNAQFSAVHGTSPGRSARLVSRSSGLPVESVTWDEANDFCRKLTEREKGQPWARKGWAYRLPTEAEWEYACRAGADGPFAFPVPVVFEKQALFRPVAADALGTGGDREPERPQEAGKAEANRFGLHDAHGNVWEWCSDWYRGYYPGDGPRADPTGPADGDKRVIRGGSFRDPPAGVRSAVRAGMRPTDRRDDVGFRVVYAPVGK
jgi:formylglycine-generating enzyme required for sulfatase activity/serine/threonine protein kinase